MFGLRSVMAGVARPGAAGGGGAGAVLAILEVRLQRASASHGPTSVLPRGGAVHPEVARGGREFGFDAVLKHVCTEHDMTQQHARIWNTFARSMT